MGQDETDGDGAEWEKEGGEKKHNEGSGGEKNEDERHSSIVSPFFLHEFNQAGDRAPLTNVTPEFSFLGFFLCYC